MTTPQRIKGATIWAIVAVLIVLFAAATADAQTCTASLSWQAPTQRTDGTPLNNLAGFRVLWGTSQTTLTNSVAITSATARAYMVEGLTPGATYYFAATALDGAGAESGLSNIASKVCPGIPIAPPAPPSGLTAETELVAFDFVPQQNRAVMLPVGRVPPGTPCNSAEAIVAAGVPYYAVPTSSVAWAGNVRPAVVYARCGG
jgi:fibronectin type 3 domain-containing protein